MRRDLILGFVLFALTILTYGPVRTHGFICYDDPQFIVENARIQSGLNWSTFVYALAEPVAGNWHPVTTLSHALDCTLFGSNPGAHHLVNVLIHAANTVLFFLLLQTWRRLTLPVRSSSAQSRSISDVGCALLALIWALHPLRVESVAWVAERKDVLSGFFFLCTLLMYTAFAKTSANFPFDVMDQLRRARVRLWLYLGAVLSFSLGLMSKPMLVTTPLVLLLLDFWPLTRFGISEDIFGTAKFRRLLIEKVPFLVLAAGDSWITLVSQRSAGAMHVLARVTWPERVANAITSCVRYFGKAVWPMDLAVIYPHPAKHYALNDQWPVGEIFAAALLLLMISVFFLLQARRRPYLLVGWLWYLGMLIPVMGLVQVGEQAMADRYTYLPMLGPLVGLAWLFQDSEPWPRKLCLFGESVWLRNIVLLAFVVGLTCLTRHQLGFWQNSVTLFDHTVAVTADNASAQFALGVGLEQQNQISRAMVRYRVAVSIDPRFEKAYYNMGQILRKAGYWPQAADAYKKAERLDPKDVAIQLNLASVLARSHAREAIDHFNVALQLDPNSVEGLNNLSWLLSTCPDVNVRDGRRAVELAQRACQLTDFKMPIVLGTLAAAYAESGRFEDAVTTAQMACAVAGASGDSVAVSKNQELANLYRDHKPYRDIISK